jgi:hypothetical protein
VGSEFVVDSTGRDSRLRIYLGAHAKVQNPLLGKGVKNPEKKKKKHK